MHCAAPVHLFTQKHKAQKIEPLQLEHKTTMDCIKDEEDTKDSKKNNYGIHVQTKASSFIQKQQSTMLKVNNSTKGKINGQNTQKKAVAIKPFPKVQPPSTDDRLKRKSAFGLVRGTPYGACLDYDDEEEKSSLLNGNGNGISNNTHNNNNDTKADKTNRSKLWKEWRTKHFNPVHFPIEGFDHIYGTETIHQDDYGAEAAAIAAHNPIFINDDDVNVNVHDINDLNPTAAAKAGREYGSIRTPLDAPIGALKDKWRVLPHFLQVRSLMRQHIDSFDYFVNTEMKEIVQSPSACEIRSEYDPKFYLKYTDCWVGEPSVQEDSFTHTQVTPFQCRLRDCTYSAPIYVNVRYTREGKIVVKQKVSS